LVLANIEPRFEKKGTLLIKELDEQLEIILFLTGNFKCGYSLN